MDRETEYKIAFLKREIAVSKSRIADLESSNQEDQAEIDRLESKTAKEKFE